jgi:DNA-binding ferritin-like protein
MSNVTEAIVAEIEQLRNRLDELADRLRDTQDASDRPKTFEVVLKVDTLPETWGNNHVDEQELWEHFNQFMRDLKEVIRLDDEGDEIKVLSVKEVTSDNA